MAIEIIEEQAEKLGEILETITGIIDFPSCVSNPILDKIIVELNKLEY